MSQIPSPTVPFCLDTGVPAGVNTPAAQAQRAAFSLARAAADEEWLGEAEPFRPKGLNEFRAAAAARKGRAASRAPERPDPMTGVEVIQVNRIR